MSAVQELVRKLRESKADVDKFMFGYQAVKFIRVAGLPNAVDHIQLVIQNLDKLLHIIEVQREALDLLTKPEPDGVGGFVSEAFESEEVKSARVLMKKCEAIAKGEK